jgi:hypothetical protein
MAGGGKLGFGGELASGEFGEWAWGIFWSI